jgi:hypothetical protein
MILPPAKCRSKGLCEPWCELSGDPANLCSRREWTCRAPGTEGASATLRVAPASKDQTGNGRAMTVVAASWLDTRQKRKNRGMSSDPECEQKDQGNGCVCVGSDSDRAVGAAQQLGLDLLTSGLWLGDG